MITFDKLEVYTLYTFEANCSGVPNTVTYARRTDVARPSAPRHINVTLKNQKLQVQWSPPARPYGPIDLYRIMLDGKLIESNLNQSETLYQLKTPYVAGTKHQIGISACNIDTQNRTLCSDAKQAEVIYDGTQTIVTMASTTIGTISSIGQNLQVETISFLIIDLMFLVLK